MKILLDTNNEAEVWVAQTGVQISISDSVDSVSVGLTTGQARKLGEALISAAKDRENSSDLNVWFDEFLDPNWKEKFEDALARRIRNMSAAETYSSSTKLLLALIKSEVLTAEDVTEIVGGEWRVLG